MAAEDKKTSDLDQALASDIVSDSLLHVVPNPGSGNQDKKLPFSVLVEVELLTEMVRRYALLLGQ